MNYPLAKEKQNKPLLSNIEDHLRISSLLYILKKDYIGIPEKIFFMFYSKKVC
jgi:hypothetical protein